LKIKMTDLALPEAGPPDPAARAQLAHNGTKAPPNASNRFRRERRREKLCAVKTDAVWFSAVFIPANLCLGEGASSSLVDGFEAGRWPKSHWDSLAWPGTSDPASVEFRATTHADEVDLLDVSFPLRVNRPRTQHLSDALLRFC